MNVGRPSWLNYQWASHVEWVCGDAFKPESYSYLFSNSMAIISCIGAFGTNENMYKICGEANIKVMKVGAKAEIERFVFISVHDYNLPGMRNHVKSIYY